LKKNYGLLHSSQIEFTNIYTIVKYITIFVTHVHSMFWLLSTLEDISIRFILYLMLSMLEL